MGSNIKLTRAQISANYRKRNAGFYSYLWIGEDGLPYYAGKGTVRRAYSSQHSVPPPADKSNIVIFPMLNEAQAFESEKALIELFGRKDLGTGILMNRGNGGEGVPAEFCSYWKGKPSPRRGCVVSAETREKQSKARMGKSPANKGVPVSPEIRAKISKTTSASITKWWADRKAGVLSARI